MSSGVPPVQSEIFPGDTQWAIAAKVPQAALAAVRRELEKPFRSKGSKVVSGEGGMSVLLVFGGSIGEGEEWAIELSREHRAPVYLLGFNDECYSIRQLDGPRVKWKKGHPARFLRSHGVTAPGYEPLPEPPVVAVGVVEDATLARACEALPNTAALFMACSRGVLVKDVSGTVTLALSRALERRSFTAFYDRKAKRFWCLVWSPDSKSEECFAIGRPITSYRPIGSILGQTTIDGVLHVLGIPRQMLFPKRG